MNRLWVRLGLMISGVLFFMFFLQFLNITLDMRARGAPPGDDPIAGAPPEEIRGRLVEFMGLSLLVGLGGGLLIGRLISRPITELVTATRRIGTGDLQTRARVHGSLEMMELAEAFNKMAADLQQAERLRSSLMADVSHELRTPLTVLEGNLRAALDHVYLLDEAEIANLYSQTRHLTRLVNDLRELAIAEDHQLPLEKQPLDLDALAAEAIQALEPLASEKQVRLLHRPQSLPPVAADPIRIRQVLYNLLTNALRHTPAGGEIVVSSECVSHEVRLTVKDSGEGLEPDELKAVFDRFYRADRSRSRETGGSGLGLAIVKALIEAHGGRVEAASPGKGEGSTFMVVLPER